VGFLVAVRKDLGYPEIEKLWDAVFCNQNVRWLQVAMNNEVAVSKFDGLTNRDEEAKAGRNIQVLGRAVFIDGNAIDVLHRDKRQSIVGRSGIKQPGNVGVIQRGKDLAFLIKVTAKGL